MCGGSSPRCRGTCWPSTSMPRKSPVLSSRRATTPLAAPCSMSSPRAHGAPHRHHALGLVPPWADGSNRGPRPINARAETLLTKRASGDAMRSGHRCLVPISGFFELKPSPEASRRTCWRRRTASRGDGRAVEPLVGGPEASRWSPPSRHTMATFGRTSDARYCPSGHSQTTPSGGRVSSAEWSKPCRPTSPARIVSAMVVPEPPNRSASVLRSCRQGPPLGRPMP